MSAIAPVTRQPAMRKSQHVIGPVETGREYCADKRVFFSYLQDHELPLTPPLPSGQTEFQEFFPRTHLRRTWILNMLFMDPVLWRCP